MCGWFSEGVDILTPFFFFIKKESRHSLVNQHISKPEEPLCPDFNGYSFGTQPDQNG